MLKTIADVLARFTFAAGNFVTGGILLIAR